MKKCLLGIICMTLVFCSSAHRFDLGTGTWPEDRITAQPGDKSNFTLIPEPDTTGNPAYDGSKPFWVEIGSNFDLIDGPKPNNLFSGVFFYKRDIQQSSLRRNARTNAALEKNLAIFAGVFESKSVTSEQQQAFSLRRLRHNNAPYVSIALSKKFDLTKLIEFSK